MKLRAALGLSVLVLVTISISGIILFNPTEQLIAQGYYSTGRSITYGVAAFDAPVHVKAQADFVADGVADNVEIQAAIDTNKNVLLSEGIFTIAATLNLNNSYQTLSGSGYTTILKPITNFNSNVIDLNANYANVENLQIDGNKANQDTSGTGIFNDSARYNKIVNILLKDCKTNGLYSSSAPADMELYQITAIGNTVGLYFYNYNGGYLLDGIYAHENGTGIKIDTSWFNMGNFRVTGSTGVGILITSDRPNGSGVTSWIFLSNGDVDGSAQHNIHLLAPSTKENIVGVTLNSIVMSDAGLGTPGTYSDIRLEPEAGRNIAQITINASDMWEHADTLYGFHATGDYQIQYVTIQGGRLESIAYQASLVVQGLRITNTQTWYSSNSGTATVLNTTTTVVVTHGLGTTPGRVQITPRENPTNAVSFWWVDTLTATQFTIHVNTDPGASGLDFDWHAQIGEG